MKTGGTPVNLHVRRAVSDKPPRRPESPAGGPINVRRGPAIVVALFGGEREAARFTLAGSIAARFYGARFGVRSP